jgi:alpha-beta hydrolase superfamily lysophospholipase
MNKFNLTEITTSDGLIHQGIYFESMKKSDTAILWVHGLTSAFYHNLPLVNSLVNACEENGFGYASFNNRGHDCLTGIDKSDFNNDNEIHKNSGGAGVESFAECVYDIDAGITFLEDRGYRKIILIGHSTGALKVGYYAGKIKDGRVMGVVTASPMSDRLIEVKTNSQLPQNIRRMKHMLEKGKSEFLVSKLTFFPVNPKRYLSLFDEDSIEQTVFDYGKDKPNLKIFQNIKTPLLVVLAENDEYTDRPIGEIQDFFDKYQKSKKYKSAVITNATHGYDGLEDKFVSICIDWIKLI